MITVNRYVHDLTHSWQENSHGSHHTDKPISVSVKAHRYDDAADLLDEIQQVYERHKAEWEKSKFRHWSFVSSGRIKLKRPIPMLVIVSCAEATNAPEEITDIVGNNVYAVNKPGDWPEVGIEWYEVKE